MHPVPYRVRHLTPLQSQVAVKGVATCQVPLV
jgi:hypothetical protein